MTSRNSRSKELCARSIHTLAILWGGLILFVALGYGVVLQAYRAQPYFFYALLAAGSTAFGIAVYLTVRVLIFRRKMLACIRHVMANEYETGMRIGPGPCDEMVRLENRINDMVDRLRRYDRLQSERINALRKALDTIYRNIAEGIMLVYPEKREFHLNPAVQRMFQVEQEIVSFDSIEKQPVNRHFVGFVREALELRKIISEGIVTLELPIRQSSLRIMVEIVPIKDKNETVALAIIFVNRAE